MEVSALKIPVQAAQRHAFRRSGQFWPTEHERICIDAECGFGIIAWIVSAVVSKVMVVVSVVSILLALVENLEKTNLVQDVVNMNQGSVFKILMFRRFCAASSPSADHCASRSEGYVITWHNHHLTDAAPQGGCPWRQSAPVPFVQRPLCGFNTGPASIPRRRRQHCEATARPEKLAATNPGQKFVWWCNDVRRVVSPLPFKDLQCRMTWVPYREICIPFVEFCQRWSGSEPHVRPKLKTTSCEKGSNMILPVSNQWRPKQKPPELN